jgi:hypothetical protein
MISRSSKSVSSSVLTPEEAQARMGTLAAAKDVSAAWVNRHAVLKFLGEHGDQAGRPLRLAAVHRKAVSGLAVSQKIARLLAGGHPRVLNLFAGCGGLSFGYQAAGSGLRAVVEFDPDAARGYRRSFRFHAVMLQSGTSAGEIAATLKSVVTDATGG